VLFMLYLLIVCVLTVYIRSKKANSNFSVSLCGVESGTSALIKYVLKQECYLLSHDINLSEKPHRFCAVFLHSN
jgi:hypothetical protein